MPLELRVVLLGELEKSPGLSAGRAKSFPNHAGHNKDLIKTLPYLLFLWVHIISGGRNALEVADDPFLQQELSHGDDVEAAVGPKQVNNVKEVLKSNSSSAYEVAGHLLPDSVQWKLVEGSLSISSCLGK